MATLKRKRNNNNNSNLEEYGYNKPHYNFPHNAPLVLLDEIPAYKKSLRNKNRQRKGKITGYFPRLSKRRRNKSTNAPMKEVPRIGRRFALMEEEDPSNNNIPRVTATRANNNNNNS